MDVNNCSNDRFTDVFRDSCYLMLSPLAPPSTRFSVNMLAIAATSPLETVLLLEYNSLGSEKC